MRLGWTSFGMHRTCPVCSCGWAGHRWECTGHASFVDAVRAKSEKLFCHRHVHECLMDHFFDVVKMRTITRSPFCYTYSLIFKPTQLSKMSIFPHRYDHIFGPRQGYNLSWELPVKLRFRYFTWSHSFLCHMMCYEKSLLFKKSSYLTSECQKITNLSIQVAREKKSVFSWRRSFQLTRRWFQLSRENTSGFLVGFWEFPSFSRTAGHCSWPAWKFQVFQLAFGFSGFPVDPHFLLIGPR